MELRQKSSQKIKNKNVIQSIFSFPLECLKQLKNQADHSIERVKKTYKKIQMDQLQIDQEELIKENDPLRTTVKYTFYLPVIVQSYIFLYGVYSFYAILKAIVLIPVDLVIGILNYILEVFQFYRTKYLTIHSLLIILGVFIVTIDFDFFDISIMYHYLRGQSAVKLYALIFALQNGQKLLTKAGKYLFSNVRDKIIFNKFYSLSVFPEFIVSQIYVILHSYMIFIDFIIYTVVLNSSWQNFIVFWSAVYLTRMKSMPSQKFVEDQYKTILNEDSKNRFLRLSYLAIFKLTAMQRQIPQAYYKIIFILIVQEAFQLGKHTLNLTFGDKDQKIMKLRQRMYNNLYLEKQKGTIQRCIEQNFTVLPYVVFLIKMLKISIEKNDSAIFLNYIEVYLCFLFLMGISRIFIIVLSKFIDEVSIKKRKSKLLRSLSIVSLKQILQEQKQNQKQSKGQSYQNSTQFQSDFDLSSMGQKKTK